MTRAELAAIGLFVVTPTLLGARALEWRQRIAWLAAAGLTACVLIAPWAIYNETRFEKHVPLSAGFGAAMRQGNCPVTYSGERFGYYGFGCLLFGSKSDDPSVADLEYRESSIDFIRAHQKKAPFVAAARVGRTFNLYRPFQQVHFEGERQSPLGVLRAALFSYWALLALAVPGVFWLRKAGTAVYPLLAYPLTVVIAVLPTLGTVRYRATAEIPLVLLAAFAIIHLLDRRRTAEPAT